MQDIAGQIKPTAWVNDNKTRLDFMRIASDMLTGNGYNIFPMLGQQGPRSLRPTWLREHSDNPEGWRVFVRPDPEDGSGAVTGRRDHFIANAIAGHLGGGGADLFLNENSENDRYYNQLGRTFGHQLIVIGAISQMSVGNWIVANMAP